MTPAEELRTAAQKIRDAAANASPGPWAAVDEHIEAADEHAVAKVPPGCLNHPGRPKADEIHIATWHPGVTPLVAVLLEDAADSMANFYFANREKVFHRELAIARAINGERR